jgi:Zn ribbon nucleic-acid-binding protein
MYYPIENQIQCSQCGSSEVITVAQEKGKTLGECQQCGFLGVVQDNSPPRPDFKQQLNGSWPKRVKPDYLVPNPDTPVQEKKHTYPCWAWRSERACATCRGIADEMSEAQYDRDMSPTISQNRVTPHVRP